MLIRKVVKCSKRIVKAVKEVWFNADGSSKDGNVNKNWLFIHWLLKKQLEEVEQKNFTADVIIKEYSDCVLLITEYFLRLGLDPEKVVLQRIKTRMKGRTKEIMEKYYKMWEKEQNERYK